MSIQIASRILMLSLVSVSLTCTSGCLVTTVKWRQPNDLPPLRPDEIPRCGDHARAERFYVRALNDERRCRASCVDLFFEVARLTASSSGTSGFGRTRQLHETALMKLVVAGQRFHRMDPTGGLKIFRKGRRYDISLSHHGFVWEPSDFGRLVPIGYYETSAIRVKHQRRGLGVPLVVQRRNSLNRPFMREEGAFSATLVMRCDASLNHDRQDSDLGCRLELYDPLRIDSVDVDGFQRKLAKDTTSPLVYMLRDEQWTYLNYFLNPTGRRESGTLYAIEPYQRDKIPLILIHGLLSDPFTWVEVVNELMVHPGFCEHYQIWAFEYSTGNAFLRSATGLREQLASVRESFDPLRNDPNLSNMVLVGHSMGGLLAKLQVTRSGDRLWNSIANRPVDQLDLPEELREEIRRLFYFQPSPDVSRVVYMATPHRGSCLASGPVGRLTAKMIKIPPEQTKNYDVMLRRNPGVFSQQLRGRIPTSIDMLNPNSQLLDAMAVLPVSERVCLHSVMGNGCWSLLQGESDGIVSLDSARDPRAASEKIVKTTHTGIKSNPEAIKELLFILQAHLRNNYLETSEFRSMSGIPSERHPGAEGMIAPDSKVAPELNVGPSILIDSDDEVSADPSSQQNLTKLVPILSG